MNRLFKRLCALALAGALAIPLFGEIPTPMQLLGAAIILGAVLLYTWAEGAHQPAGTPRGDS